MTPVVKPRLGPQRPFVEVGAIESQPQSMSQDGVDVISAKLRAEAAKRESVGEDHARRRHPFNVRDPTLPLRS
jgi:hypothetical protein